MNNETSLDVLLIDDEISFTEIIRKRLAKRGLNVRVANNGQQGVREFSANPAEVVILDMRMPEMDGVDTLRAILALEPEAQVIFLTGHVNADTALEGLDLGAFDYCLKPIDIDTLYDKIIDAAERKRLGR